MNTSEITQARSWHLRLQGEITAGELRRMIGNVDDNAKLVGAGIGRPDGWELKYEFQLQADVAFMPKGPTAEKPAATDDLIARQAAWDDGYRENCAGIEWSTPPEMPHAEFKIMGWTYRNEILIGCRSIIELAKYARPEA